MSKIGILVCGNSGVDYEKVAYPFEVIHSTLIINNKEYEDYIDITADEFYDILSKNPNVSLSTAQASTGLIVTKLEKLKSEGYDEVIAVIISSALSGTAQNVKLAGELVEGIKLHLVDSHTVSYGQMFLVNKTIEMIKAGKPANKIVETLEVMKEKIQVYVLVDTLKFLVKNGRLSATSGAIGSLLKIKPLLNFSKDGKLVPYEKIRTASKARARLIEIIKEEIDKGVEELFFAYTNNKPYVEGIQAEIKEYAPKLVTRVVSLTPVVGAHAGPGTCGVGILRK